MMTVLLVLGLLLCVGAIVVLAVQYARARRGEAKAMGKVGALTRDKGKDRLLDHLGHELRNPINAILGMADMILDERSLPAELQSNIHVIRGAANQLMMVAANLTAYQFGDGPALAQHRGEFFMSELIDDVTHSLGAPLLSNRTKLDVHHELGAPNRITADRQFLMLILRNVLAYAIGETRGGNVTVTVHGHEDEDPSAVSQLFVSVEDNGAPATQVDDGTMFEPYGQDTQLRSSIDPGTGMNLGVGRNLARKLGGELTYRHHPNAGNIFEIRLPVVAQTLVTSQDHPQDDAVVPFNDTYTSHRKSVPTQRILVTEDQRSNQQLIQAILQKAGHQVTIASTGDDSIEKLQNIVFDLCIMDLRLPGTSGLDVMQLTRMSQVGANRRLPFIVLTGETTEPTRQACIAAGAAAFLAKPISAQRLLDTIRTVVEHVERIEPQVAKAREQINTFIDLASASLSPRLVVESMKDAMQYVSEAKEACAMSDFAAARQRFRAIRGTSHVLGATHLSELCTRLLVLEDDEIARSKQMIAEQLDKSISGTRDSIALITKDDLG